MRLSGLVYLCEKAQAFGTGEDEGGHSITPRPKRPQPREAVRASWFQQGIRAISPKS
jgi:hypothetical protein